jgi:predicted nucleic acid-binding protein
VITSIDLLNRAPARDSRGVVHSRVPSTALMVLVDTDVLVDCLRGTYPAKAWLEHASTEVLGIPGVVAMELLIGCHNRAESSFRNSSSRFQLFGLDAAEFAQACELLAAHRLTSGLGIPHCLIAAMSLVRKAR